MKCRDIIMLLVTFNAEQKRLLVISTVCFCAHLALLLTALPPARSHAEALVLTSAPTHSLNIKLTNQPASTPVETTAQVQRVNKPVAEKALPRAAKIEQRESVAKPIRSISKQKSAIKEKPDVTVSTGAVTQKRTPAATASNASANATRSTKPAITPPLAAIQPSGSTQHSGSAQPMLSQTTSNHEATPRFRFPPEPPVYPVAARQRKQEGTAIIEVELSASGSTQRISLVRSSGFPLLDRAALQAVKRWQFLPKQINGVGIAHQVRIPVRFQLT
ncbi:hypothetical protein C9426_17495 [Serratia sp. S1B]|nr:hypothetical protein C9426_17495 [Serratia sp. S1B]